MQKLSVEWIKEYLKKRGIEVTSEQAIEIHAFMNVIAKITIAKYLRQ